MPFLQKLELDLDLNDIEENIYKEFKKYIK